MESKSSYTSFTTVEVVLKNYFLLDSFYIFLFFVFLVFFYAQEPILFNAHLLYLMPFKKLCQCSLSLLAK